MHITIIFDIAIRRFASEAQHEPPSTSAICQIRVSSNKTATPRLAQGIRIFFLNNV